jgi:hypothetical protein
MLQPKKKICCNCNTEQYIWKNDKGNKYCKKCWLEHSTNNTPLLRKTPTKIKAKSDKRSALDQLYSMLRNKFLSENSVCAARLTGCTLVASDVHHKKGRGNYYLDITTFLPVCRSCHSYIELHPNEAKELGFSLNRLENEQQ